MKRQHLSGAVPFLSWFERTLFSPRPLDAGVCVTVLKVHLFTCVFQHMFQGLLIIRSHLKRGYLARMTARKCFPRYKSTEAFASGTQTVFFLLVDPMDKEHKDPDTIDLEAPRLAQHMHKAWKKHQNTVYWVDINLALEKGLKFYQTRSNAIILHETLPAYCIPKVVRMETGEVIYEKVFASPRPPPRISLKHDWMKNRVQKLLDNQMEKLFNNPTVPNQADQIQTQIMIELGNPLFALKEEQENRPVPRRSKRVRFMKKL